MKDIAGIFILLLCVAVAPMFVLLSSEEYCESLSLSAHQLMIIM